MSEKPAAQLKHSEVEKGSYGQHAPIRYVPEPDPVNDALSSTGEKETNSIKVPGGTRTHLKVYDGNGGRELLVRFVAQSYGLMKRKGLMTEAEEADEALQEATAAKKKAKAEVKACKAEEAKLLEKQPKDSDVGDGTVNAQLTAVREKLSASQKRLDACKKQVEEAEESRDESAKALFDFFGSNVSQSEQTIWEKIVKEQTEDAPYTDVLGEKHDEAAGKSLKTFSDCLTKYLRRKFAFNAAESQKQYIEVGIKKSSRVQVRPFYDRVVVLNDYIDWLPSKYNSPHRTPLTPETEKLNDYELVKCIIRALPESWQNKLNEMCHNDIPEETEKLLSFLEIIEKSPPVTTAPHKVNPAQQGNNGEKTGKKRQGGDPMGRIPKKPRKAAKHCAHCAKWGGKEQTHNTDACLKWNSDGTPKEKKAVKSGEKKAKKSFAQMKHKLDEHSKLLKRFLKKEEKKSRKRSRSKYYSSDSDSDSS